MSAPLRFLAVALLAWGGLRAATLGALPGAEAFTAARAQPPPIVPTVFPPLPPVQPELAYGGYVGASPYGHAGYPAYPPASPRAVPIYYYPAALPAQSRPAPVRQADYSPLLPEPAPLFYPPTPELDEWPLSRLSAATVPERSSVPTWGGASPPRQPGRLDRLQLSTWALLRGPMGPQSLASGGTLGGSQAGARLIYNFDRRLALSLRSSSPVGGSGAELAAGVRVTPLQSLPVAITAERRQALGRHGGRSAFALLVEGGLYQRPLPWKLRLDAYAQGGVVGIRSRDLFADGAFTLTRPLLGPTAIGKRPLFNGLSAGLGVWGGAQPGLYRIDAGPRVSMRVGRNMRIDFDWRQRLAGSAEPGSGPAVTLAGDF